MIWGSLDGDFVDVITSSEFDSVGREETILKGES
jgi:hypothetical protein